jgi:hypothetical protein
MIEIQMSLPFDIQTGALDEALRSAYPAQLVGVSSYGRDLKDNMRPLSIWCEDATTLEEQTEIQRIAMQHDPVFLSLDTMEILANGKAKANLTVQAPRPNAAPVVIETAWKRDGTILWESADDWAIPLVKGAGVDHMLSTSKGIVMLRVKNGVNRSTEVLRVRCL